MPYGRYEPNSYQVEALTWATQQTSGRAVQLAESIRDLEDTYTLIIGEAGPNWQHCEFTQKTLFDANQLLRTTYQQLNTLWADGYSRGDNS